MHTRHTGFLRVVLVPTCVVCNFSLPFFSLLALLFFHLLPLFLSPVFFSSSFFMLTPPLKSSNIILVSPSCKIVGTCRKLWPYYRKLRHFLSVIMTAGYSYLQNCCWINCYGTLLKTSHYVHYFHQQAI